MAIPFVSDGASSSRSAARLLSARVQQANRSMQARAALAHGVSQQAFKHGTGILIAGVIAARVTPIGKVPLGGAEVSPARLLKHGIGAIPNRIPRFAGW